MTDPDRPWGVMTTGLDVTPYGHHNRSSFKHSKRNLALGHRRGSVELPRASVIPRPSAAQVWSNTYWRKMNWMEVEPCLYIRGGMCYAVGGTAPDKDHHVNKYTFVSTVLVDEDGLM